MIGDLARPGLGAQIADGALSSARWSAMVRMSVTFFGGATRLHPAARVLGRKRVVMLSSRGLPAPPWELGRSAMREVRGRG